MRIDCPVTKGYRTLKPGGTWGLEKDARLRLWPAGGAAGRSGDVRLSRQAALVRQRHANGQRAGVRRRRRACRPTRASITTTGSISAGRRGWSTWSPRPTASWFPSARRVLDGYKDTPVDPRYDVVYLLDDRGWFYRYSHLHTIAEAIKPGRMVKIGQPHRRARQGRGQRRLVALALRYLPRQPSGEWGVQEGYGFLWEAYLREHKPEIIAVARPHHFATIGEAVTLDGSPIWSRCGRDQVVRLDLHGRHEGHGAQVERTYDKPGSYSEILKVTDAAGHTAYDFAVVQVIDPRQPEELPPSIQAAYSPTLGIKPGDEVTFHVRSFRTSAASETWHFGDGSEPVKVKSDGNASQLAKDGFAVTKHRFANPGTYLVRVRRTNRQGFTATAGSRLSWNRQELNRDSHRCPLAAFQRVGLRDASQPVFCILELRSSR